MHKTIYKATECEAHSRIVRNSSSGNLARISLQPLLVQVQLRNKLTYRDISVLSAASCICSRPTTEQQIFAQYSRLSLKIIDTHTE